MFGITAPHVGQRDFMPPAAARVVAVQVRPQRLAGDAGNTLDVDDTLRGHTPLQPLANGGMGDAKLASEVCRRAPPLEVFMDAHVLNGSCACNAMQAPLPPLANEAEDTSGMEAKLPEVLGARLLQARNRAKLTQTKVAEELGITHSAVGQWERGKLLPSLLNLIYVGELYPASIDWLVWGMGNNLDARVRKLPPILREPLLERLNREIEDAEKLVRRLPSGFSNETIKDDDGRLNSWSAAAKQRPQEDREREKVRVKRRPDGTQ